ncbi:hypothetical protein PInf_014257 [Phytophthora infestans]|nr:hypothetical protein PInf_014257 [Phytophthora infestans]
MLRRHPTRVEERADVAAEYEAYLIEKESQTKLQSTTSPRSERSLSALLPRQWLRDKKPGDRKFAHASGWTTANKLLGLIRRKALRGFVDYLE